MNSAEVYSILQQIAATSSRNEKEEILAKHINDACFKRVIQYACDPMITFGVSAEKPSGVAKEGLEYDGDTDAVWGLLDELRSRLLTGNAAKSAVADLRSRLSSAADEVIWRILSKDLRAGMTANTVNRVLPGTIPIFSVMLAHKFEDRHVHEFPVAVEPKLDGIRVICLVRGDEVKFFTRTGKLLPALDHLATPVATMIADANKTVAFGATEAEQRFWFLLGGNAPKVALDAEVVAGSFNKTTGDVRRKSEAATDAELNIFDAVPYDFMIGTSEVFGNAFKERRQLVNFIVSHAPLWAKIRSTPLREANDPHDIQNIYEEYRDAGLEGAMVKPWGGLYHKRRSRAWMKMKAIESEDLRVIRVFEGTGKNEGALGGLIVDRAGVEVRVGGGFSDAQRQEIWRIWRINPDEVVGRLVEVEFHEETPDGSLRHPRWLGWRDDKDERRVA